MRHISELILEELVFEKLCVGARLADLILFEEDLDRSIDQALEECRPDNAAKDELLTKHVEKAWKRWIAQEVSDPERSHLVASSIASLTTAFGFSSRYGSSPSGSPSSSDGSSG